MRSADEILNEYATVYNQGGSGEFVKHDVHAMAERIAALEAENARQKRVLDALRAPGASVLESAARAEYDTHATHFKQSHTWDTALDSSKDLTRKLTAAAIAAAVAQAKREATDAH